MINCAGLHLNKACVDWNRAHTQVASGCTDGRVEPSVGTWIATLSFTVAFPRCDVEHGQQRRSNAASQQVQGDVPGGTAIATQRLYETTSSGHASTVALRSNLDFTTGGGDQVGEVQVVPIAHVRRDAGERRNETHLMMASSIRTPLNRRLASIRSTNCIWSASDPRFGSSFVMIAGFSSSSQYATSTLWKSVRRQT